ncbi:MAG TPA: ATP-binding protein [Candidatus Methylacidiphilales bacterium]|nr:ATP-binding protein [Candidatus Methylacidiphilales bacterium]
MDAQAHRFLEGFTPVARERLLGCMIRENYPDGAYLFHEGDPEDGVHLVLEGGVEIVRAAGAHEKILDSISPGDYFGEVAVLDGLGRSTAARARGATSIARIPGPALLEILAAEPGAATLALFQHVLFHLRRATDMVVREIVHKEKLSLVGEMASSLMHDLRTPVSSIRLSADLINAASGEGKIPRWCDGIRLQCDRLVGMAAELMEFSKGESKLTLSRTRATAFLEQFQALNEGSLAPSGIEVHFDAEPAEIEIDTMRMQRVLQNLVTNAVEALQLTPRPRIEIKAWVKDSAFYLAMKDNGPGIPAAIQGRIFEPFVTHGKSEGIGLGMAIVRNIVTAHGGTITFETAPDQGASFLIAIPQKTATGG